MKSARQNKPLTDTAHSPFFKKGKDHFFGDKHTGFFNPPVQAKLTIGQPNDPYEQEADAMADQVVQRLHTNGQQGENKNGNSAQTRLPASAPPTRNFMQAKCAECEQEEKLQKEEDVGEQPDDQLQRKSIFEGNAEPPEDEDQLQRKCATCEQEETPVQREAGSAAEPAVGPSLENRLTAGNSGGAPLAPDVNEKMGHVIGADFSHVRIHTDSTAVQMNKELHAQAFTHGSDIYFNAGKYNEDSDSGQQLLAHELTHVVQQGAAGKNVQAKKDTGIQLKPDRNPVSPGSFGEVPPVQLSPEDESPGFFSRVGSFVGDIASGISDRVSGAASAIAELGSEVLGSIRSAVSSGITTISESWNTIQGTASSLAGNLRAGASAAVEVIRAPFSSLTNAIMNIDAEAVGGAWNTITGVGQSVLASIQQLIAFVTGTLQQAWQMLSGLIAGIIDRVRSVIEGLRDTLGDTITQVIQQIISPIISLQNSIQNAWNSVMQFISGLIRDIQTNTLSFIQNIVNYPFGEFLSRFRATAAIYRAIRTMMENPDVLVDPMATEIAPMLESSPSKAAELIGERAGGRQTERSSTSQPDTVIQRQGEARTGTGVMEFLEGLWRHIVAMWNHLSIIQVIKDALYTLINPVPGTIEDWNNMKKELRDAVQSLYWEWSIRDIWTIIVGHLLNFVIIILRFITSVLGRWWLWITIALTLGGALLGGILGALGLGAAGGVGGAIFGAGFGAAPGVAAGGAAGFFGGAGFGAGAGLSAGLAFGEYLLIAYIAVELVCVVHALLTLFGLLTQREKERYFQRVIVCAIGAAVGGLLIALSFAGKAIAEAFSQAIGRIFSRVFPANAVEGFSQGFRAGPRGPISRWARARQNRRAPPPDENPPPSREEVPAEESDQPPAPERPAETDNPSNQPSEDRPVTDPLETLRATIRARIAQIREHLGRMGVQTDEIPVNPENRDALRARVDRAQDRLNGLERDLGETTAPDEVGLINDEVNAFERDTVNPLQEEINAANIPLATPEEQVLVDQYTDALRRLRQAQDIIDAGATGEPLEAARAEQARAGAEMDAIEARAVEEHNRPGSRLSRLLDQINTLTGRRLAILNGTGDPAIGRAFPECEAVRAARRMPNRSPRGLTYQQIEDAIGRPPDRITGSLTDQNGRQTGAVRLEWEFGDGSRIHVDVPGPENASPFAINRAPHAGLNAPRPSANFPESNQQFSINENGVVVPQDSAPAHMPVQPDGQLTFRLRGRGRSEE